MIYVKGFLATAAAAAAIVIAAMWMSGESERREADMRPVLQNVTMTQTLHLQLTVNGEVQKAWVRRPGQLRIDHPDGTYRIVHGSRQWDVDEKANRASTRPATFFVAAGRLDPLSLLGVSAAEDDREALAKATRPGCLRLSLRSSLTYRASPSPRTTRHVPSLSIESTELATISRPFCSLNRVTIPTIGPGASSLHSSRRARTHSSRKSRLPESYVWARCGSASGLQTS